MSRRKAEQISEDSILHASTFLGYLINGPGKYRKEVKKLQLMRKLWDGFDRLKFRYKRQSKIIQSKHIDFIVMTLCARVS